MLFAQTPAFKVLLLGHFLVTIFLLYKQSCEFSNA
jgi:hypothetical protein